MGVSSGWACLSQEPASACVLTSPHGRPHSARLGQRVLIHEMPKGRPQCQALVTHLREDVTACCLTRNSRLCSWCSCTPAAGTRSTFEHPWGALLLCLFGCPCRPPPGDTALRTSSPCHLPCSRLTAGAARPASCSKGCLCVWPGCGTYSGTDCAQTGK